MKCSIWSIEVQMKCKVNKCEVITISILFLFSRNEDNEIALPLVTLLAFICFF